jgi:hypothetical protein
MYISMAFISFEFQVNALPFIERWKQSLIRSWSESIWPSRVR